MFIAVEFRKSDLNLKSFIDKILEKITPYIPLGYDNSPCVYMKYNFLFFSFRRSIDKTEKVLYNEEGVIFYDGYFLCDEIKNIDFLEKSGGVKSYLIVNDENIVADNSSAGLFSIYYSFEDRLVLSSRPLFVELIRTLDIGQIKINKSEINLVSRLAFGSWIDGSTGFECVKRLTPEKKIKISFRDGKINFENKKIFFDDDFSCESFNDSVESLAESLLSSISGKEKKILLMSGGKDSRTIAAALDGAGKEFSGIVNGDPANEEVIVAKNVFENCSSATKFEINSQRAYYDSVYSAMESSLRTEGQVSHVAHQIYFDNLSFYNGHVYHGHGHLLRGGTGGWPISTLEKVHEEKLLSSFISGWINKELTNDCSKFLKSFYSEVGFSEKIAFYAHLNFRVGAYQSPGILEMSGLNEYRFPLCDDKVVNAARKISLNDLRQEKSVFAVISKFSKNLSSIPLYGEMWAFEKDGEDANFPGRKYRVSSFDKNHFRSKKSGLSFIGAPRKISRESVAAQFIIDSGYLDNLRKILTKRMINIIESYATEDSLPAEELLRPLPVQGSAKRKIFEIFGMAVNQETNWLRQIRSGTRVFTGLKFL